MKQTSYDFATPAGIAGGLYDLTSYVCDSYNNEAEDGALKHGMGVVLGTQEKTTALPSATSTLNNFEGVLLNGLITEHNLDGDVTVRKGQTVGVIKQGRVWVRVTKDSEPAYGKPVFLAVKGNDTGLFTTEDDTDNAANVIGVNAMFLTEKDTSNIAAIELYHKVVVAPAVSAD